MALVIPQGSQISSVSEHGETGVLEFPESRDIEMSNEKKEVRDKEGEEVKESVRKPQGVQQS